MKMKINVDASVESLARLKRREAESIVTGTWNGKLVKFPLCDSNQTQVSTFRVMLDYPLSTEVRFSIQAGPTISVGTILHAIAKKYQTIYRKPSRYGVWGHGIDDLYIETLTLDFEKGVILVDIGS